MFVFEAVKGFDSTKIPAPRLYYAIVQASKLVGGVGDLPVRVYSGNIMECLLSRRNDGKIMIEDKYNVKEFDVER